MALKVLVFESDVLFANQLLADLKRYGAQPRLVDVGDPESGFQFAAFDRPDLILLTIELFNTNGFALANRFKKDPVLRSIPLIILSSECDEQTFASHQKLRTRAEAYLRKPFRFADLVRHIEACVSN
jgi:DNA-binding response OmpR family regulator